MSPIIIGTTPCYGHLCVSRLMPSDDVSNNGWEGEQSNRWSRGSEQNNVKLGLIGRSGTKYQLSQKYLSLER